MTEKTETNQRFCGNCGSHNAYNYPMEVFCTNRFLRNKAAIVKTLWCCEEWHLNPQKCECVEEAKKKRIPRT
jgi:hypothetical protein